LRAAERDARMDSLTHIPNRRAFDEHVTAVHALFERQRIAYSVVMLDLDNFKSVNDRYGHAAGDSVLQVIAKLLQSQLRLSDRVFRFGGEEFVIVLVATNLQQAMLVAERARKRIEASIVYFKGRELRITTSAGVCEVRDGLTSAAVLAQADAALYGAKSAGRNRIEATTHLEEACVSGEA
jgi:diguanylate cyclase (GGDEF)-like protein